jgi:hypothetical protein
MKGEPKPGPGPRKCWACGNEWILRAGQPDNCPHCGRPTIVEGKIAEGPSTVPGPTKYLHVPPKIEIVLSDRQTSPQEELERTQKNIRRAKGLDEPIALTVGDLSVVEAKKNSPENVKQRLRDLKEGLSIGDLSIATAKKDGKGLNELFVGRHPVVKAFVSESEEIKMDMMKKRRKQVDERFHIQNLMATGQDLRLEEYADKYLKPKA